MSDLSGFAKLDIAIRALGSDATEKELRAVSRAANEVARQKSGMTKATEGASKATRHFGKEMTVSSGRLKVVGRDINRYVTLPMLAFSAASIKFARDLNTGLGNVQTLIPDTGDRIYELRDAVRSIGAESGKSFKDLTDGLYTTISVFQDNADTIDRLNTAVRMGIAGAASTTEAVQLLSSVTRAYGDTSADAVQKVADLAFTTVRLGATNIPALSAAMQIATDRADRLGVSQEELFTVFATLTGITGDASMVATQYRSAMDSLINPTQALTELFEKLGYANAEAAIESMGLVGVLSAIQHESDEADRPLQDYIRRIEGITLTSRLAGQQMGDFTKKLEDHLKVAGAQEGAYSDKTEGIDKYGHALNQNKQRMITYLAVVGDRLLPVFNLVAKATADLVEVFARLPQPLQATLAATLLLVSAMGILLQIKGAIASLAIAGVFVKLAMVIKGAAAASFALTVSLGGVLAIASLLIGVFTVLALAEMDKEKREERLAEMMERRLKRQKELLQEIADLQRSTSIHQNSLTAQFAQDFRQRGEIPGIHIDSQTGDIEHREGTPYIALEQLTKTDKEWWVKRYKGYLQAIQENRKEIHSELQKLTSDIESNVTESQSLITGIIEGLPSSLAKSFKKIEDEFEQAQFFHNLLSDDILRDPDRVGREALFRLDEDMKGRLQDAIRMVTALGELRKRAKELGDDYSGSTEEAAKLTASIQVLEGMLGDFADPTGDVKEPWTVLFKEITGVALGVGASFDAAGKAYAQAMNEAFAEEILIAELLGREVDTVGLLRDDISKLEGDIRDLLRAEGIEDYEWYAPKAGFHLYEEESKEALKEVKRNGIVLFDLLEALAGKIKEFHKEAALEMRKAWEEEEDAIDSLRGSYDKLGISTSSLQDTQEGWVTKIRQAHQAIQDAERDGVGPLDEAMKELTETLRIAEKGLENYFDGVKKSTRENINLATSIDDIRDSLVDAQELFTGFMYETYRDGFRGRMLERGFLDELKELRARVVDRDEHGIGFVSDKDLERLEELENRLKGIDAAAYVLGDIMGNLLSNAINVLSDSFYDLGRALRDSNSEMGTFGNILANTIMEIIRALPTLMIQGGLQLLGTPAWAFGLSLIALGLAGQVGMGYLDEVHAGKNDPTKDMYAKGGIINTPTSFGDNSLAGEQGWEALLPLTRTSSGDLGVHAVGGGGGTEVNIDIKNYAGVEVEQTQDEDGKIEIILRKAVKGMVGDGTVDKEMRTRYGVRSHGSI